MVKRMTLQIGDLVRIRENINLVPLTKDVPDHIPAGIYGEVTEVFERESGEVYCQVEFHEPYEIFNELVLAAHDLELMFRISLN
ncbi:MAG: hypothetical protein ACLFTK_17530 [Anaerolineales bacterium]